MERRCRSGVLEAAGAGGGRGGCFGAGGSGCNVCLSAFARWRGCIEDGRCGYILGWDWEVGIEGVDAWSIAAPTVIVFVLVPVAMIVGLV